MIYFIELDKNSLKHINKRQYGISRILLALTQRGIAVRRSSVRHAMKRGGLLHRSSHHPNSLTKADLAADKAENLIRRDFSADAPNRGWQISCTSSVWTASCTWQRFWTSPL